MAIAAPVPRTDLGASAGFARAWAAVRIGAGVLMIGAIAGQFTVSFAYWRRIGLHDLGSRVVDFLSAFTHEVNVAGGVILIVGAVLLLRGRGAGPGWYTTLRLAVLPAILVAGIVYNLLLRPLPVPPGSQLDWANEVMHVVGPLLVLVDWLVAPRPRRLRFRAAWLVLVFPVAWLIYTFVRGPLVPDELTGSPYYYPYRFLDPHGLGGWGPVAQLVGELMLFALVLGLLAVLAWRVEDRVAARRSAPLASAEIEPGSATTTTRSAR